MTQIVLYPSSRETEAMGREIESCQGIGRVVAFKIKKLNQSSESLCIYLGLFK
jgi:hypothetical protein